MPAKNFGTPAMVVALALVVLVSACSTREPYWSRPGATAAEFGREGAGCRNVARSIAAAATSIHWLDIYDDCMRSHGWEKN